MKWLKLWTEARNDGKLRSLSDRHHRIWFRLLCMAAEQEPQGVIKMTWKVLAAEVADNDIEELKMAVEKCNDVTLVTRRFCDENCVEISFTSFAKRQKRYPSESLQAVAARVAKSRSSKKLRTPNKAKRNVTTNVTTSNEPVTAKNDSETETDNTKKILPVGPPAFSERPPHTHAHAREANGQPRELTPATPEELSRADPFLVNLRAECEQKRRDAAKSKPESDVTPRQS